jgi:hypothetical protein
MQTTKQNENFLDENRILHSLISEQGRKKENPEVIGEWSYWATLDAERANIILRETLTGMLVSENICTEYDSKNYINKLINERVSKMNAKEIKIGSKYNCKIGANEVPVTVKEETGKGWIVESAAGKTFPINNAERFIKCLDVAAPVVPQTESTSKVKASPEGKKMSMLDAAVKVLKSASQPMSPKEIIAAMEEANLWKSPSGHTPANSLAAAAQREIANKENPRFKKTGPGKFAIADEA